MKNTPTPWQVAATAKQTEIVDNAQRGNWTLLATAVIPEDAEFIVLAVNAHQELLSIARKYAGELDHASDVPGVNAKCGPACDRCVIEQTIAKAEGRS